MDEALLIKYPYKPYAFLAQNGIPQHLITTYFSEKIKFLVNLGHAIKTSNNGSPEGFALYRHEPFDTAITGMTTAKIEFMFTHSNTFSSYHPLISSLVNSLNERPIQLTVARVNAQHTPLIHALEHEGFQTVDTHLTFAKRIAHGSPRNNNHPFTVREAIPEDSGPLQETIAPTFTHSRFFVDPAIGALKAQQVHKTWIENSIRGDAASRVFTAHYEGRPVGFIAINMDENARKHLKTPIGHITLIGSHPKFRGKNIARILIQESIARWFLPQQAEWIVVETQATNIPAVRSYEHEGFRLADSSQTLRLIIQDLIKP